MKGIIFVNPFGEPKESIYQAERLKEEFDLLGVSASIDGRGYLKNSVKDGKITADFDCDFAIYLDKDKYFSACLEKNGIKLFNSHSAIRTCDDKGETYIALSDCGVNMPYTVFAPVCYFNELKNDLNAIREIGETLSYPVIVKESYGSKGKGVYKADNEKELIDISEKLKTRPHLYQRYIGYRTGTDIRAIVIGGKFVCAMLRENKNDFRSNIALGGKGKAIIPPESFIKTAEKCAKILNLDYCGVDLLFDKNDEPCVCEVNSNAFIGEIEKVTGVNVAKKYAEYIFKKIRKN